MSPRFLPVARRRVAASDSASSVLRRLSAGVLVRASIALERLAVSVGPARPPTWSLETASIEFESTDDPPGGALYADGVLVGRLEGVRRL